MGKKEEEFALIKKLELRNIIQIAFILFMLHIGWQFYRFVTHFKTNGTTEFVQRPPSVESFLPISALIALKSWLANNVFDPIHPAGLTIFLAVLLISFMYKRGFCSWICPIGTSSEGLWKLGKRIFKRNLALPKYIDWPLMLPKYLILAFFLKAILLGMNATAATAFLNSPYNRIADAKMLEFWINPGATTIKIMLVLVLLSIPLKNFWCRYLCPYGALLGLFGFFSPLGVTRDQEKCIKCGACSRACPNQIKVDQGLRVDSVECTSCLDCIESCTPRALSLKILRTRTYINPRYYPLLLLGTFFFVIFIAKATGHWETILRYEDYRMLIPMMHMFSH
ncbi:MAG: 4Fe-4S binding protein [Candidatus Hydrothermarchaeales archaeon]